jgi:tetratricopeptide (TPR) repeat protein
VAVALALAAIALALYARVLTNGFVYDDSDYVVKNPHLRKSLADALAWAFTSFYSANWHPLTWVSHILDVRLFGLDPWGHHLVNVLFHATNAVLLFQALRLMTGFLWRSAFVAGLFAVHPLHVESVAWVAERKDVLSCCCFLLTLLAYVFYVRRPSRRRYLTTLGLFVLGLLAKPMLVTVPFVLLLVDWWPLARHQSRGTAGREPWQRRWLPLLLEKTPFLAFSLVSIAVTVAAQRASGSIMALPLATKLGNVPVAYVRYLGKTLWPAGLACYYPLPASGTAAGTTAAAALLVVSLTAAALLCARRLPWFGFGWFWFLGTLVPVIGLVQVGMQSMADRYTYIPLVGAFIVASWGAAALLRGRPLHTPLLAGAGALTLVALGAVTVGILPHWKSNTTLATRALATTTDNWWGHSTLGSELHLAGRDEEALPHYREALALLPLLPMNSFNFGVVLAGQGRFAEALPYYSRALELDPKLAEAHVAAAIALAALGRRQAAATHNRAALALEPGHEVARVNLANNLDDLGRVEEALALYREALRANPENALAHYNLGAALQKQRRWAEAAAEYREVVRLRPQFENARLSLDSVTRQMGR